MDTQKVEKNVISTIQYFTFFKYAPNFAEIYTFYPGKIGKKELSNKLNSLVEKNKILKAQGYTGTEIYTPRGYRQTLELNRKRALQSAKKEENIQKYFNWLGKVSSIQLIGLSGSVAMRNAIREDDIDLFVITSKNRLWTGRFLALILASLLGRRRKREDRHVNDKICLNLFFTTGSMAIPRQKRSYFVAHEVLQMKPRIDKAQTYRRFLEVNKWVFDFFPNARLLLKKKSTAKRKAEAPTLAGDFIEFGLKKIQLGLINRHKTTEIILPGQLWFFPDDFEKKIKNRYNH